MSYEPIKKCRCDPDKKVGDPASGLIEEIMNKYFCQRAGQGSSCSLFSSPKGSIYSMDKRLLYWKQILEDRKKIACRIQKATGKRISHVLYNQIEEHRNVQNVKRIMDYAQRLDPTKLSTRTRVHLQDPAICETLPQSERLQMPNLEIVGSPKVSKAEQWMSICAEANNSFLSSNILQRKLKSNSKEMEKIIEFYPDIDGLQVVGQRIHKHKPMTTEPISDFELSMISSVSNLESWEGADFPEYSIKINDTIMTTDKKSIKSLNFELDFKCKPHERQTQALFKIENVGRRPVRFVWKKIKPAGAAYIASEPPVLFFNQAAFTLTYGESQDIEVLFTATEQLVHAEDWWLKTTPDFFANDQKLLVQLSAQCYIPPNYFSSIIWDLLESLINNIIPGSPCERRREVLSETEFFDKLNPGFKCKLSDLRKYNELYRQVKKKTHPSRWDMNLQTLKQLIESVEDFTLRATYLETFTKAIRAMRKRIPDSDAALKVLLVRGLILSILDKWETKAMQIVQSVTRTNVDILAIKMPFDFVIEQLKDCKTDEEKRKTIKHNALYIQMYCVFCDLAEDIVSFMENCLLLYTF